MTGRTVGRLRTWAQRLKTQVLTLWFCTRHPRTPFFAKFLAVALVAYAFSPIDLIPDFIPVLGYLDDLIILPLGIWLVMKLVPEDVMEECRRQAARALTETRPAPGRYVAACVIFVVWILILWMAWRWTQTWEAY